MFSISSLSNVVDTLSDPNLSVWEKFSSTLMSASMTVPMLMSSLTGLKTVQGELVATLRMSIIAKENQNVKDVNTDVLRAKLKENGAFF